MTKKPVIVNYSASDFLGGTVMLEPLEELAHRRLCDLIYVTGGDVLDEKGLATFTKTGRRWPKIRQRLIDLGKIKVVNGRLSQPRCRAELWAAEQRIVSASKAGLASAEKRKYLKERERESTGVPTTVERPLRLGTNAEGNGVATNHDPRTTKEEVSKKETNKSREAASPNLEDQKTQFYARGKDIIGTNAGGMLRNLLKACDESIPRARAAIEQASIKTDAREYIGGLIKGRKSEAELKAEYDKNIASGLHG